MSNQVLSCLVDPTDITGLVNNVQISGPSIKFLIDNVRMQTAAWACEASCFANNPAPRPGRLLFEGEVHAFMPAVLLGVTRSDAPEPPHRQLRQIEQGIWDWQ